MDFKTYQATTAEAAQLFECGQHDDALRMFMALVDSDLPDLDRVVMAANVANIHAKLGRLEEAASWYAKAVAIEERHGRVWARIAMAGFLAANGRARDAATLYEDLAVREDLTLAEREAIEHNLAALKRSIGESQ